MNNLDHQIAEDIELGGAVVNLLTACIEQARKDMRNRSASRAQKKSAEHFLEWARKELAQ